MKKILVVDDDEDILSMMNMVLTQQNFLVKTISKWQSIQATIKQFVPDLILLDIDLRGADGGDICKKLKKSTTTSQVPVILISALMPEEYVKTSKAQGYLPKPFEVLDLIKTVNDNLH